ncbi:MAG: single-stranded DNA-binding protein [Verrucomicrobiota bacterium]
MASFNKVILLGNLTRDPEMRMTPGGLAIAKFGLAVNRKYTTKDGESREEVTFVDCDAFGKQAEIISQYVKKGGMLFVEGRLKLDQWESNTGEKRSKLGVVVDNFQLMPRSSDSANSGGGDRGYDQVSPPSRPQGNSRPATPSPVEDIDDDVPF